MASASALNSWAAAFGESAQVSAAMIAARARPAALTATARMVREGRSIAAIVPVGRGARNWTMVQFRPGNAGRYAPAAAGRVGVGGGESAAGGVLRGRLDPGPIGDANQFGERYRAHLLHHPAAMDLIVFSTVPRSAAITTLSCPATRRSSPPRSREASVARCPPTAPRAARG